MQDDRVGRRERHGGVVHGVRRERVGRAGARSFSSSWPIETQVSVATTSAPLDRVGGVRGDEDRAAVLLGELLGARRRRRRRAGSRRGADAHVHARQRAAQQVGVGHVVGAVAEVGQAQARELALVLGDGHQVGEDLAGVEVVGERVDHRAPSWPRPSASSRSWPKVRQTIAATLALEDAGGVRDRLAAADLAGRPVDDQRVAAEVRDAGGEGDPGAGSRACRR